MRELFIYYQIHMNLIEMAQRDVPAFQAGLAMSHPGLVTRLLVRAEAPDSLHQTWMEHYTADAHGGVSPALQAQIEHAATALLSRCIAGPRHTEVFIPCAS